MPTPDLQRMRKREQRLLALLGACIVTFVLLFVVFSIRASHETAHVRSELHTAVEKLDKANAANEAQIKQQCEDTNVARRTSNAQLRKPLKDMLGYFVAIINRQIADASKPGGKPLPNLARTLEAKEKFEDYYRRVTVLGPLDCTPRAVQRR